VYTYQIHDQLRNKLTERGDAISGRWGLFLLAFEAEQASISQSFDELACLKLLPHVLPFPHQVETAKLVINELHGRALLADEVGLGKTIEAGLVLK
jgi:SNF2 family DNA or RNA helicase